MNKKLLSFRLISLTISVFSVITFCIFCIIKNENLLSWIRANLLISFIYLVFFIGISVPINRIIFGLYWNLIKDNNIVLVNKRDLLLGSIIFVIILFLFIISFYTDEIHVAFSILILSTQFIPEGRVILKNKENIYYTDDMRLSYKKIDNFSFIEKRKRTFLRIYLELKNKKQEILFHIPTKELINVQKILNVC
jgi:hypothetical protein